LNTLNREQLHFQHHNPFMDRLLPEAVRMFRDLRHRILFPMDRSRFNDEASSSNQRRFALLKQPQRLHSKKADGSENLGFDL